MRLSYAALRVAAFGCALGIALPSWAQVTPTVNQASPRQVEFPRYTPGGAVQLFDLSGNVIGTSGNPLVVNCNTGCTGGGGSSSQGTPAAVGNAWPVTLAIGGALDAVGNPIFVAPGTGATFAVTGTFWQATQPVSIATAPVLVAGSALIGKVGIDQTTPGTTNAFALGQIGSTTVVTGGVAGSLAIGGPTASGSSVAANPLLSGGRAQNAEPTAVTNGQAVAAAYDLVGRAVTSPWANKENWISGTASGTDTAAHTIIASAGGSLKNYVHSAQCFRTDTGTTAIVLTFNDAASSVMILPAAGANFAGSGGVAVFEPPIATAAATAFTFTSGASTTTVYCNAQGFKGT